MSCQWSRSILLLALLGAARGQVQPGLCPSYQGKHPLSSVSVFDGPPEEKADLVPDTIKGKGDYATSSWSVGYIFESKRGLYLVCRYAGAKPAGEVAVKVEKKVNNCTFRMHGKANPAEVICK